MLRVLEPEVMDSSENALAYASADFSTSNQSFVDNLVKRYGSKLNKVIDLGCGPGDIAIRLAKALSKAHVTAVDASQEMLDLASKAIYNLGFNNQINLVKGYLPGLPFKEKSFDGIISNSLLHHLPNPILFWEEVKKLGKNGAVVFICDLIRPDSKDSAKKIIEKYAGNEHPVLKEDFYNSLLASFTVDEIKEQLKSAGLLRLNVETISDRHYLISGLL